MHDPYIFNEFSDKVFQYSLGASHYKNIFLIFAQNIDCGYTLEPPHRGGARRFYGEAVLTSTHNLCFAATR